VQPPADHAVVRATQCVEVQAGIRAILLRQEVQKEVNALRQAAKIEIVDPELKKLQEEALKKAEEAKKNGKADQQPQQ
jgi:23S rRNA maturation mini-RNase III